MPQKAFTCNVELDLYTVTCPGTLHLTDRNMVFLNVKLFGQTNRTKSVFASFPMNFNERFAVEQTFTSVSEPSQVVELLDEQLVVLELRQYSEHHRGGKLLGRYKQTTKEFLYPTPTLTGKGGIERDLLLSRTVNFNGIDPKLEFSSRTTVQEVTVRGISYQASNEYASEDSEESNSEESETEEEVVIHPNIFSPPFNEVHCVCECPRRPENKGMVVKRSRSLSPNRSRPRSASPTRQPPFRAGKADEGIISKREFHRSKKSRLRPLPAEGDPMPCPDCKTPHKDCIVCQAYYKVFGRDFLKHRFTLGKHRRTTSVPTYSSAASEPPILRSRQYFERDTGPAYHERAYSAPIPRTRLRFSSTPKVINDSFRAVPPPDEIHERVERIIRRHSPKPAYRSYIEMSDSDDDSLLSLQELRSEIDSARMESLDRSFEDPDHPTLGTRLDRSLQRY
ncbi:uncharacterized protein LOC116297134 isoform X2 [Actinia tenebrosa]|uniref:Uncharacterized protein LOC116297134 isoform X2 n=1 Tax=Actinia tenebrosa TaxID=6105 RepID=A0A6P8I0B7_ACTTE|nr:uncharacterized protein LOC116297134 isoform X2 [Actinia tenebrosa]